MANNKIQIKRSIANSTVTGLSNGELAFTANGNIFYIGSPVDGTSIRIGGQMVPGTLTANQALVANATSGIDKIIVANLQPVYIFANGASGTTGQILYSNSTGGTYWAAAPSSSTPGGADTQVQFNDGGSTLNATAGFTFTKSTNNVTIANTLLVGAAVNAASHTTGSGYGSATGGAVVNTTNIGSGNSSANTLLNYGSLSLNGGAVTVNSASITYVGNTTTSPTITLANTGSFTIGNSTTTQTTSIISVSNSASNVQITPATLSIGGNVVANSTGANNAFNLGGTAAASYQLNSTLAANVATLTANNANNLGTVAAANYVQNTDSRTLSGNLTFTGANLVVSGTNTSISSNVTITGAVLTGTSTDATFRNGTFSGNLIVSGTVVTVNTQQLVVNDNIIELGLNNTTTDVVDSGFFSPAGNSTAIWYSGIARIAASSTNTNPVFRVFVSNTNPNTSSTIDTSANTRTGTIQSYLQPYGSGGAFVVNATAVALTANSTVSVSITGNTLSLSTPLSGTNGGTGLATTTNNSLYFGNSTNGFNALALGTSGYVLQSNGTAIVYDTLDGGTF